MVVRNRTECVLCRVCMRIYVNGLVRYTNVHKFKHTQWIYSVFLKFECVQFIARVTYCVDTYNKVVYGIVIHTFAEEIDIPERRGRGLKNQSFVEENSSPLAGDSNLCANGQQTYLTYVLLKKVLKSVVYSSEVTKVYWNLCTVVRICI